MSSCPLSAALIITALENEPEFRDQFFFDEHTRQNSSLRDSSLPKGYQWVVEVRNKGWLSEKLYSVLRRHKVALALVDHPWMPRPGELFNAGNPITADFTFVRWLGDRKGIEEQTKVWDKVLIDRTEDLREWVALMRRLHRRRLGIERQV